MLIICGNNNLLGFDLYYMIVVYTAVCVEMRNIISMKTPENVIASQWFTVQVCCMPKLNIIL